MTAGTDHVERMRELSVTLTQAADEMGSLYGPIWHEREALRGEVRVLLKRLEGIADRIAAVPVQIEDAYAIRRSVQLLSLLLGDD